MIEFDLPDLHPTYERVVIDTFRGLEADYPYHAVELVTLYEPTAKDRSLGHSDKPGMIQLNAYWFTRPVEELQQAARDQDVVSLHGGDSIAWHGSMSEPLHVLTHEFGHQLQNVVPWAPFARSHWSAACRDPIACRPVSGYAFSNPDEYWAETFAAMRLGIVNEATRMMKDVLRV